MKILSPRLPNKWIECANNHLYSYNHLLFFQREEAQTQVEKLELELDQRQLQVEEAKVLLLKIFFLQYSCTFIFDFSLSFIDSYCWPVEGINLSLRSDHKSMFHSLFSSNYIGLFIFYWQHNFPIFGLTGSTFFESFKIISG